MGLKLRNAVSYAPSPDGMLFRFGDRILPVKGQNVFAWFTRLEPLLCGDYTLAELSSNIPEHQRPVLHNLCDALRDGGLLYECDAKDVASTPSHIQQSYAGVINTIESRSNQPLLGFSVLRATRLLIIGRSELVCEMLAAALEIGICSYQVHLIDPTAATEAHIKSFAEQQEQFDPAVRVTRLEMDPHSVLPLPNTWDVAVLAADCHQDQDWLERLSSNPWIRSRPMVPLLQFPDALLAGPAAEEYPNGCIWCLFRIGGPASHG